MSRLGVRAAAGVLLVPVESVLRAAGLGQPLADGDRPAQVQDNAKDQVKQQGINGMWL